MNHKTHISSPIHIILFLLKRIAALYLLTVSLSGNAQTFFVPKDTAILTDEYDHVVISGNNLEFLSDSTNFFSFKEILKKDFHKETSFLNPLSNNKHYLNSYCWYKFTIVNHSSNNNWIIEFPDQTIDYLEIYIPDSNYNYIQKIAGDLKPFHNRVYEHKNFIFHLPFSPNRPLTIYFKIKSAHYIYLATWIRPNKKFKSYAFSEYIGLGVFYSFIVIIAIINLFLLILIREKTYFLYILYILSMGLFLTTQDGIGFQYIWPTHPEINNIIQPVALYLVILTMLVYSRSFLQINKYSELLDNLFLTYILIRSILFYAALFFYQKLLYLYTLDLLSLLITYITGILIYKKGNKGARLYIIGFSCLLLGFLIDNMEYLRFIKNHFIGVYATNIGAMFEMTFLSLAFADQLRIERKQKELNYKNTISELKRHSIFNKILINKLKERDKLNDRIKNELDKKVEERTSELNKANEELKSQAEYLNYLNAQIDLDNYQIKKKIITIEKSRITQESIQDDEFFKLYPDEISCLKYLAELKWKKQFECRKCKNHTYSEGNVEFSRRCNKCNYIESATANTLFHRLHFPLNKAFYLLFLVTVKKKNITLKELSETLGIRKNTCWTFRKKINDRIDELKEKSSWENIILNTNEIDYK